jgi:hypothetical protein
VSITLQIIGITFDRFGNTLSFFRLTDGRKQRRTAAPGFAGRVVRREATISDGTRGRSTLQKPPFLFVSDRKKTRAFQPGLPVRQRGSLPDSERTLTLEMNEK